MKKKSGLFRVRFQNKIGKDYLEVRAQQVDSSEFFGFVSLKGLIFEKSPKNLILPSEDAAAKLFADSDRIHIPLQDLISIEELSPEIDEQGVPKPHILSVTKSFENPELS